MHRHRLNDRRRRPVGRRMLVGAAIGLSLLAVAPFSATAGEGPRLFFDADQVDSIRERAAEAPYRDMIDHLKGFEPVDTANPVYEYAYRARDNATLYLATGDRQYAQAARQEVERILHDWQSIGPPGASSWRDPSWRSLGRGMMGTGVAIAYDLTRDSDVWDEGGFRQTVSTELHQMGQSLLASGGGGWPGDHARANNWHGVRYGSAGLTLLATDEPVHQGMLDQAHQGITRYLHASLTTEPESAGWSGEGIGYKQYPWQFIGPYATAYARATGSSIYDEAPNAAYSLWSTYFGAVPIERSVRFSGLGLAPDLANDNNLFLGEGTANLALKHVPEDYRPGVLWQYDRLHGNKGDRTWDAERGGTLWALLHYPPESEDVEPQNPEQVWGLTYLDRPHGVVMNRNRYQDEGDFVSAITARRQRPANAHSGPDLGSIRITGYGVPWAIGGGRTSDPATQSLLFAGDPADAVDNRSTGDLVEVRSHDNGSGLAVVAGSVTGVSNQTRAFMSDYSGLSGAEALYMVADSSDDGTHWRLNTPEFNEVQTDAEEGRFLLTGPHGDAHLFGQVLWPTDPAFSDGLVTRGSDFFYALDGHSRFQENRWLDVIGAEGDGDFLVLLMALDDPDVSLDDPATLPQISYEGEGLAQTIRIGEQRITVDGMAMDWIIPEPGTLSVIGPAALLLLRRRPRR